MGRVRTRRGKQPTIPRQEPKDWITWIEAPLLPDILDFYYHPQFVKQSEELIESISEQTNSPYF